VRRIYGLEARRRRRADAAKRGLDPNKVKVEHTGLWVWRKYPQFGGSPDGIVHDADGRRYLLEIKCPARKRLYGDIPVYYLCQIYANMAMMNLSACFFVVYTPYQTQIQVFSFNAAYWDKILTKLLAFHREKYAPLYLWKSLKDAKEKEEEEKMRQTTLAESFSTS
jgi:hypothetical protein